MPQIRCPNCGLTISMKNRKEIDLDLITHAVQSGPKTFTYLLHATKLPRKTLCLRLRELCEGGMILKREGVYMLDETRVMESRSTAHFKRFSAMPYDKRVRAGILLALLIVSTPVAAQVLASLFITSLPAAPEPVIIGSFNMVLKIHDVSNLYGWQVCIAYNKAQIKVLAIEAGDFPETILKGVWNMTSSEGGFVFIGDSLIGSTSAWSGSCRLAIITFGYYVETYTKPDIVPTIGGLNTALCDSAENSLAWENALALTVENP